MTEKPKKSNKLDIDYVEKLATIVKQYDLESIKMNDIEILRNSKQIKDAEISHEEKQQERLNKLGKNKEY